MSPHQNHHVVIVSRSSKYSARLRPVLVFLTGMGLLLWCCAPAFGAGFALFQQGTAATAQGNAFVADASDPSAIFYNPAGLTQLKRPEIYLGNNFYLIDREYHGPRGEFAEAHHSIHPTMSVYLVFPATKRITLGLGLFSPFGLSTTWPSGWDGRYLVTFSQLKTYNLNPVIAFKALDNLSLAVGFDVMWSSFRLKRRFPVMVTLPFPPFPTIQLPDGKFDLGGDGTGFGYNLGLLYEPVAGIKLGVHYRSEIYVDHSGELNLSYPPQLPGQFRGPSSISGSGAVTYPPSVTAGINISTIKPWAFEFDVTWTGWSTYNVFELELNQPLVVNGVPAMKLSQPKHWHDAWAFRFGANYELKKNMKLRAGYIYDLTPVPNATLDPQVPDSNRHIFSVGGDLKVSRFTLGIAYSYLLGERREKWNLLGNNQVALPPAWQANGLYRSDTHALALSVSCQF